MRDKKAIIKANLSLRNSNDLFNSLSFFNMTSLPGHFVTFQMEATFNVFGSLELPGIRGDIGVMGGRSPPNTPIISSSSRRFPERHVFSCAAAENTSC